MKGVKKVPDTLFYFHGGVLFTIENTLKSENEPGKNITTVLNINKQDICHCIMQDSSECIQSVPVLSTGQTIAMMTPTRIYSSKVRASSS